MGCCIHLWIHPVMISAAECPVRRWGLVGGDHCGHHLEGCILVPCPSLLSLLPGHHGLSIFSSAMPLCHPISTLERVDSIMDKIYELKIGCSSFSYASVRYFICRTSVFIC